MAFHLLLIAVPAGVICIAVLVSLNRAKHNQLRQIAGPPVHHLFDNHLRSVLDPSISPQVHQHYVSRYGRSIRIRGIGFWDDRLLTLDPVSVSHILKNTSIYQKPWQSRKFISSLIGCGLLAAEGETHRRQRRVASPAFSAHNLHALVPLVFRKAIELKDKWVDLVHMQSEQVDARVDVCHWISRATFDVIGLAGFEYDFNAIHDETNELFSAYKEMFEVSISQTRMLRSLVGIYLPWIAILFPDKATRTVRNSQSVIRRVAGKLIQAKKQRIMEGKNGNDLLSLLLASNLSEELAAHQRISDEDILHNINTFMFAGSDTSSLTLTWTLWLLAQHPEVQDRLRCELLSIMPKTTAGDLTDEELLSLYDSISHLPYLHNVTRETIRLIPPVHSSIRVATEDDEIPTAYPVRKRDGSTQEKKSVSVAKGTLIHVAIEGFNLDKEIWGEDAWDFNPDRWERLPERVSSLPGLFSNTLTFSAGPRSCIGMRFAMIEIKTVVYMLVGHFQFRPTEERIMKANVVLTRPYVRGRYGAGSQCPLFVGMSRGGDKERERRMLSFQQQQNGANGEQLAPAMRLRDDPPPITPASTRNPRKRKSPPSLNPDPTSQQIHHVLPPPHPLIHSIPPPPIPPFPYPTADYSPGGLPPPQPPQSDPNQQPSPTQSSAAGRSLSQSKRAEQNRKAQRAFRERRDQHVKALESRSQLLDAALASADEANRRWEECRALVDQLRVENAALRAALSQSQLLSPTNALAPLPPPPPPPGLAASAPNTVSEPHSGSREEQTPSTVPGEDVKHHEPGLDKRSSGKD